MVTRRGDVSEAAVESARSWHYATGEQVRVDPVLRFVGETSDEAARRRALVGSGVLTVREVIVTADPYVLYAFHEVEGEHNARGFHDAPGRGPRLRRGPRRGRRALARADRPAVRPRLTQGRRGAQAPGPRPRPVRTAQLPRPNRARCSPSWPGRRSRGSSTWCHCPGVTSGCARPPGAHRPRPAWSRWRPRPWWRTATHWASSRERRTPSADHRSAPRCVESRLERGSARVAVLATRVGRHGPWRRSG